MLIIHRFFLTICILQAVQGILAWTNIKYPLIYENKVYQQLYRFFHCSYCQIFPVSSYWYDTRNINNFQWKSSTKWTVMSLINQITSILNTKDLITSYLAYCDIFYLNFKIAIILYVTNKKELRTGNYKKYYIKLYQNRSQKILNIVKNSQKTGCAIHA